MSIIVTRHVVERMGKYGLSLAVVENGIHNPEVIVAGNYGRKIANKRLNGYVLRVICGEKGNDIVVVTVYKAKVGRYEI